MQKKRVRSAVLFMSGGMPRKKHAFSDATAAPALAPVAGDRCALEFVGSEDFGGGYAA